MGGCFSKVAPQGDGESKRVDNSIQSNYYQTNEEVKVYPSINSPNISDSSVGGNEDSCIQPNIAISKVNQSPQQGGGDEIQPLINRSTNTIDRPQNPFHGKRASQPNNQSAGLAFKPQINNYTSR